MRKKGVVRATHQEGIRNAAFLRLFSIDQNGYETLVATSAPVTKVAAVAICRLFEPPFSVTPDIEQLTRVFRLAGKTAWAGFTAAEAANAALQACLQHDMSAAQGALVIITLSWRSNIVENVRAVLGVVHSQASMGIETGVLVAYDQDLDERVKVEILLTGM